jgi:imidazole glycerol-phosphate synthase subunit HisF
MCGPQTGPHAALSVVPHVARPPTIYARRVHYKRVIPCLDVDGGRVVKGVEFLDIRDAGDPVELAAHYDREGADELVFLDITATHERRDTIVKLARDTADDVFVPFTIGGGIRSVEDAQAVLDAGADKVSVNSAALARPELIDELAAVFGAQCVVLAIDAKADGSSNGAGDAMAGGSSEDAGDDDAGGDGPRASWQAYVAGGRTSAGRDAVQWAREGASRGAGEILLTSMDRDGTSDGYDLPLTTAVSSAVDVPVIASGGAGELQHLVEALQAGADAVLCASIFHYNRHTVAQAKQHLAAAGIPVRID